jgi:hypothetical protein
MGFLDPKAPGLFGIGVGGSDESTQLKYWRHEFRTYKEEHRKRDERRSSDGEWHVDGTPHVDNYHMVVAISGTMPDGQKPAPGMTPAFQLVVTSDPSAVANARRRIQRSAMPDARRFAPPRDAIDWWGCAWFAPSPVGSARGTVASARYGVLCVRHGWR